MSRKSASFNQVIEYIAREGRADGDPVLHNMSVDGHDLRKVNSAFMRNARHCPPRKNGVLLYHEILSLAPEDKPHATPEKLADLAEHYLSLRAPGAMAWGMVHFDENPHVHLVVSANLMGQKKKLRLSKKEFSLVKRELEAYQRERYPELIRSIVFDEGKKERREMKGRNATEKIIRKAKEQEREKRLVTQKRGVMSQKEALCRNVLDALTGSVSLEAFTARLEQRDIVLYQRRGRLAGIISNKKKYRFRTLGLEEVVRTAQNRWERLPGRKDTISDIVAEKARSFFRDIGFAREIMDVFGRGEDGRGGDQERRGTLRSILRKKRMVQRSNGRDTER